MIGAAEIVNGAEGNDSPNGTTFADFLSGGLGNDIMLGGTGNDIYVVDATGDRVFETSTTSSVVDAGGIDTVQSAVSFNLDATAGVRFVERLTLTGTANVNATGNALANILTGNAGNNVLNGGLGNDVMLGGVGNDTFNFNTTLGVTNIDRISDFTFSTIRSVWMMRFSSDSRWARSRRVRSPQISRGLRRMHRTGLSEVARSVATAFRFR